MDIRQHCRIERHHFDQWAETLMSRPLSIDASAKAIGTGRMLPTEYRSAYLTVPVQECGEPLVKCCDYGLVSGDFYLERFLTGHTQFGAVASAGLLHPYAWLRLSVVRAVATADSVLRGHDLFLVVRSGWRSPRVQEVAKQEAEAKFGAHSADLRFAAPHSTPHATGGAFDVELWSLQTAESLSRIDAEDDPRLVPIELAERLNSRKKLRRDIFRILHHALTTPGVALTGDDCFVGHPAETWHFGRGDQLSAVLAGKPIAIFGATGPG